MQMKSVSPLCFPDTVSSEMALKKFHSNNFECEINVHVN